MQCLTSGENAHCLASCRGLDGDRRHIPSRFSFGNTCPERHRDDPVHWKLKQVQDELAG